MAEKVTGVILDELIQNYPWKKEEPLPRSVNYQLPVDRETRLHRIEIRPTPSWWTRLKIFLAFR